jgi:D-glycerate 3-kinase
VLFLEGWCIGCPAPPSRAARASIHDLGPELDADHLWRRFMLRNLGDYAQRLNPRLGVRWFMTPPGWQSVVDWRWQQEQQLARPRLQNPDEVAQFLATYEPLCHYMLDTCQDWADRVIRLDTSHCPIS